MAQTELTLFFQQLHLLAAAGEHIEIVVVQVIMAALVAVVLECQPLLIQLDQPQVLGIHPRHLLHKEIMEEQELLTCWGLLLVAVAVALVM
jgi:hypothetical protein